MDTLEQVIAKIEAVPEDKITQAYERLDSLTKPRRSLGYLEELAARYAVIRGVIQPRVTGKRIVVFAGDHHVVEEGVSAYPQAVTALMVKNFLGGGAAINVLARRAGADLRVLDIGMAEDLGAMPGLVRKNVKRGAANIARGPAMTLAETRQAIMVGIECAAESAKDGISLLGTGEMGIGNTTPASALFAAYLEIAVEDVTGPGTGLDSIGMKKKIAVIKQALAINPPKNKKPLEILAALGGLEIAGICGLCLGGAAHGIPVVVDGFISSAGALAAMRLQPAVKDHLIFAHMSAEPGHKRFFQSEGLRPVLDLGMRLGEGTGAAVTMQIIEDAVAIYNDMATFADAGIKAGA